VGVHNLVFRAAASPSGTEPHAARRQLAPDAPRKPRVPVLRILSVPQGVAGLERMARCSGARITTDSHSTGHVEPAHEAILEDV
jgi:hypothetical protein